MTTRPAIALPLAPVPLAIVIGTFVVLGLVGHDPWKPDDAIGIGVAYSVANDGWLFPRLAGEPHLEAGPLYFWIAAALGKLLASVLPFHDGARLASGVFMLAALWFVRLAARELYGKRSGDLSMLAMVGCLGLVLHAHEAVPDTAMLAGGAAAYYGLAIAWKKPLKSAAFFAGGAAAAFLASGLPALLPPVVAALGLLPVAALHRTRRYVLAVVTGTAILVPLVAAWPLAVAHHLPGLLPAWTARQVELVSDPVTLEKVLYLLKTLSWAAWPAWPLAFWAAWEYRRELRNPGFAVPFVATVVTFGVLLVTPQLRDIDAIAMLAPLSIPAGAAAVGLRRGAANALAYFSVTTFTLVAGTLWLLWFAKMTGFPAQLWRNVTKLAPGFVPEFHPLPFVVAVVLTGACAALVLLAERSTLRSLTFWASGVALGWSLAVLLWTPWADYLQSYRLVAQGIAKALPEGPPGCVAGVGLGDVQRAALHYHGGVKIQPVGSPAGADCPWLVVQARADSRAALDEKQWINVWQGGRPRDRDLYFLYRRR